MQARKLSLFSFYEGESPAMAEAASQARRAIKDFIRALESPKRAQQGFRVKVPVKAGKATEHFWIDSVRLENGAFFGQVDNQPRMSSAVAMGDQITVRSEEISDWMYIDNGGLVGGWTIRVMRDAMNEVQRENFDESVPFVIFDPTDAATPTSAFFRMIGNGEYSQLESNLSNFPTLANQVCNVAMRTRLGFMGIRKEVAANYAIYCNDVRALKILLKNGADPNFRDECEATPLFNASMRGSREAINLLIDFGSEINSANRIGVTPLAAAVVNGNIECVTELIRLGADVRKFQKDGTTVLHLVKDLESAKVLVAAGAEVNAIAEDGWTPLHSALYNGYVEVAELFIAEGVNTALQDIGGHTALYYAKKNLTKSDLTRITAALAKKSEK